MQTLPTYQDAAAVITQTESSLTKGNRKSYQSKENLNEFRKTKSKVITLINEKDPGNQNIFKDI